MITNRIIEDIQKALFEKQRANSYLDTMNNMIQSYIESKLEKRFDGKTIFISEYERSYIFFGARCVSNLSLYRNPYVNIDLIYNEQHPNRERLKALNKSIKEHGKSIWIGRTKHKIPLSITKEYKISLEELEKFNKMKFL